MKKTVEPLPPTGGNGRRMRTIEFDEADAPLLMAAMRLAAGTALHYGPSQRKAMARLRHYQELFLQFAPAEARLFREEAAWTEMAIAMDSADEFTVEWSRGSWPNTDGRATVTIGSRSWETRYDVMITPEQAEQLARALEEIAPAGCIRKINTPCNQEDRT